MNTRRMSDDEYLREIERLAQQVVAEAGQEGSIVFSDDGEEAGRTRLQRAITALARHLRFNHYDRDGCVDHV